MSRTILVTGATGMLGRVTAQQLLERGDTVRVMQRGDAGLACEQFRADLTDTDGVQLAMRGVDGVIHCAAKVSMTGARADFQRVNVTGTQVMLHAAQQAGVASFVHVSTPSVAHVGRPIVGDDAMPADPDGARGNYAQTKAQAEVIALASTTTEFSVCAIRPHLIWGPGDEQLVARILARAAAGRLFLIDHGHALIDTTYIDNAADALVHALDACERVSGQAFVVSNGEPRSVSELIERIAVAGGYPPPGRSVPGPIALLAGRLAERIWQNTEPPLTAFLVEQLSTAHWFDQRRTRALLSWNPRISLDTGFTRLAQHLQGAAS